MTRRGGSPFGFSGVVDCVVVVVGRPNLNSLRRAEEGVSGMGCSGLKVEGVDGKPNRKGELLSFVVVVVERGGGNVTTGGGGLISDISGSFGLLGAEEEEEVVVVAGGLLV